MNCQIFKSFQLVINKKQNKPIFSTDDNNAIEDGMVIHSNGYGMTSLTMDSMSDVM